jgi:hypothetical protein
MLRRALLLLLAVPGLALADPAVQFSAQVDRTEVGLEESVALKFSVRLEGAGSFEGPSYDAPDFDVVNEYSGTFVESYYENGRFGMRNNRQVTKVLKPRRTGELKITNLAIRVGGKVHAAPPITVRVGGGGAGTPPPRGYGGGGVGLRGAGKRVSGPGFFVRAEIDKQKAFKGEQIIVSYYLYARVRTSSPQIDKFPTLNGFLREDLEMPAMGQRLETDQVVLDGVAYQRALLTRYAAYPLKEGKLTIDPLSIKLVYYGTDFPMDQDDPITTFFQQLVPGARQGTARSEPVTVEVESLPDAGRPPNFSGGVGDFTLASAVDKYELRANEALTLTLKVEGRGNVASIEEPKAKWPDTLELYESKGRAKTGKGGVGEKIFEFLLIPRAPGKLKLPGIDMAFFDPVKREYVARTTEPIELNVLEPAPGSPAYVPGASRAAGTGGGGQARATPAAPQEARPLKPLDGGGEAAPGRPPVWQLLFLAALAGFVAFGGWAASDWMRREAGARDRDRARRQLAESKSWQRLRSAAKAAAGGGAWNDVIQAYERLSGAIYDAVDRAYGVSSRSISRVELGRVLTGEKGLPEPVWQRTERLLEFAEAVRYATAAGAVTENDARTQLERWVVEGQALEEALLRQSARNPGKAGV